MQRQILVYFAENETASAKLIASSHACELVLTDRGVLNDMAFCQLLWNLGIFCPALALNNKCVLTLSYFQSDQPVRWQRWKVENLMDEAVATPLDANTKMQLVEEGLHAYANLPDLR